MDTMIYASFGAFRQSIAEKSNEPELPEAEFTPLDLAQNHSNADPQWHQSVCRAKESLSEMTWKGVNSTVTRRASSI
jgi:hypothetical protein